MRKALPESPSIENRNIAWRASATAGRRSNQLIGGESAETRAEGRASRARDIIYHAAPTGHWRKQCANFAQSCRYIITAKYWQQWKRTRCT